MISARPRAIPEGRQHTRALRDAPIGKGWKLGGDLSCFEAEGAGHNEKTWAARWPLLWSPPFPPPPPFSPPRGPSPFAQDHTTWRDYAGGPDSAQYSALKQINRSNVSKLEIAWTYPTGDGHRYLFNPVMVDGVMYVLAKGNSIVALDAAHRQGDLDVHDRPPPRIITNRGINYWESKDRADRRSFASNHFLRAIDARTGKPIPTFGRDGAVDLKEGLGRDPKTLTWCNPPRRAASSKTC